MRPRVVAPGAGALGACVLALAGCTSFSTVRSAAVRPGPAVSVQASVAAPPGDDAAWFWAYDCAQRCDRPIAAVEAAVERGWRPTTGPAFALAVGVSGVHPYADAYVQVGSSRRTPAGVGARIGNPFAGWREHQLYARLDVALSPR